MDGTGTAGLGLVALVAAERYLPALSSLPLPRRPCTAPHHHETTGEYDTMRHFKRPRPHPHNVYYSVTLETFYFIVSYCREALTVPNLQVKLYPKYLCLGENRVYAGSGTIRGFGQPLGGLDRIPPWNYSHSWKSCSLKCTSKDTVVPSFNFGDTYGAVLNTDKSAHGS